MRIADLDIDPRIGAILAGQGVAELYPPQAEAIGPALEGRNLVLAIPTASGKSLVAYLAILKSVLRGGKSLYIVPLRALAAEKYDDLRAFESLGVRVALSMGDYDSSDTRLEGFDVIVATSEKADSLLRHRSRWLERLTVVVADEVHLINEADRGPTLEVTLAKLRQVNPRAQIIALSATIRNSHEIADWLGAVHVKSDWRPVPLKEGVYFDGKVHFDDGTVKSLATGEGIEGLVVDVLQGGGQALIFTNTRQSTESLARDLTRHVMPLLRPDEQRELAGLSEEIATRQDEPTSVAARLARCIRAGTAFHHAGLLNEQRRVVETAFRKREIKCIVATPTLASGVNLPARRVIIRDVRRFEVNFGFVPISVLEIRQMCGRAGRPQYDDFGEAILVARREGDLSRFMEDYVLADPEAIESKLSSEAALRVHLLALVATSHANTEAEVYDFMGRTFFAHQSDVRRIRNKIDYALSFLRNEGFLEGEDRTRATTFGRRTSDLYVDPLSAVVMRDALRGGEGTTFAILHALCRTPDMPKLYLREKDYEWVVDKMNQPLLVKEEDEEFLMAELKTASLFEDWVDEFSEDYVTKKYGIGPGDVRRMVEMGEWLTYSMAELAKLFDRKKVKPLSRLMVRVHYGVKEELLDLVNLRGVGRVRARALFDRGFRTREDLKVADAAAVAKAHDSIGPQVADRILAQVRDLRPPAPPKAEESRRGQSVLLDFPGESP